MTPVQQVVEFNARVKLDDTVLFGPTDQRMRVRGAAIVLGDGRAVVWLHDVAGAVDLDMVRPG